MQKKNSWNILRVLTTNACNYRCIYCHNEGQVEKNSKIIDLNQFIRIYKIAEQVGINEVRFSGGEPLINPNTICMIEWLNQNSNVEIGLATNGSLVTEEIAKRLGNTRTMVTLHFPSVGNEKYHYVTGQNWQLFLQCVDAFDNFGVDYSFNFTLFPEIIDSLDKVVEYVISKGKRVKLLPYLDSSFRNLSESLIREIFTKLDLQDNEYIYVKEAGYSLWEYKNKGCVKLIDSPCYKKDIDLCKTYGEIRLLPDLSLMNCIFGNSISVSGKTDEEIYSLFIDMFESMKKCDDVIMHRM